MDGRMLKAKRIEQKKSVEYMARLIGKSPSSYQKKERGEVSFSRDEMIAISNDLCLSPAEFNAVFCDSKLLFSKKIITFNAVM